jgi:hypothetical protein
MQAWRITKSAKIVALDKIYNEFYDLISLSTHADLSQLNLTPVVELEKNFTGFYNLASISTHMNLARQQLSQSSDAG